MGILKIKRLAYAIILLSLLMLFNGCASVGRNFHYENIPQLKIGMFKIENCEKVFGKPHKVLKKINEHGQYDVKQYLYASANVGTASARVLVLEFLDGSLNAYNFISSFDEDRTLVEIDIVNQIVQGKSTKEDVLKLMGDPTGIGMCPSILDDYKNRCDSQGVVEIWTWGSQRKLVTMAGGRNQGNQSVFISFDANDIVVAFESAE